MIIFSSESIVIDQKYGLSLKSFEDLSFEEQSHLASGDYGVSVIIRDTKYDVIPSRKAVRSNDKSEDGKNHLIYIQINLRTCEYYIGKVNRKKWNEVKRYQGSGLVFTKKYKKHSEDFIRYYIAACHTERETELLEAQIVNEELVKDPFCLNLVRGGGGVTSVSSEERNKKIRDYMLTHPENYKNMLETAKELYQSGDSAALKDRSEKIRKTMQEDKYREMMSERIKNWRKNNPEGYKKARENNKKALQTDSYRKNKKGLMKNGEKIILNSTKSI